MGMNLCIYVGPYILIKGHRDNFLMGEKIKEAMFSPPGVYGVRQKFDVWIPNTNRKPPREFGIEESDGVEEFDEQVVFLEKNWLTTSFGNEISILKAEYQTDGVVECGVKWGIVKYYL